MCIVCIYKYDGDTGKLDVAALRLVFLMLIFYNINNQYHTNSYLTVTSLVAVFPDSLFSVPSSFVVTKSYVHFTVGNC